MCICSASAFIGLTIAAIPFTKNYGNEGRLNLRYVFDRLFCPIPEKKEDYYIGKELVQVVKDYKDEWDKLKKIAQILREKLAR